MEQLKLFPKWVETLKSGHVEQEALKLAQTQPKQPRAKHKPIRAVVDVNRNGIQQELLYKA